ncbi:MAG: hypothetical protein EBS51_09875 [Planctomycetia bacterium]|nr:hypothetical protein [Planctomycetia bacterium]
MSRNSGPSSWPGTVHGPTAPRDRAGPSRLRRPRAGPVHATRARAPRPRSRRHAVRLSGGGGRPRPTGLLLLEPAPGRQFLRGRRRRRGAGHPPHLPPARRRRPLRGPAARLRP